MFTCFLGSLLSRCQWGWEPSHRSMGSQARAFTCATRQMQPQNVRSESSWGSVLRVHEIQLYQRRCSLRDFLRAQRLCRRRLQSRSNWCKEDNVRRRGMYLHQRISFGDGCTLTTSRALGMPPPLPRTSAWSRHVESSPEESEMYSTRFDALLSIKD